MDHVVCLSAHMVANAFVDVAFAPEMFNSIFPPPISMQRCRPGNPESSVRLLNIEHVYVFSLPPLLSWFSFHFLLRLSVCVCACAWVFFICPLLVVIIYVIAIWQRVHSLTHSLSHILLSLVLVLLQLLRLLSPFADPSRVSVCVWVSVRPLKQIWLLTMHCTQHSTQRSLHFLHLTFLWTSSLSLFLFPALRASVSYIYILCWNFLLHLNEYLI